MLRTSFLALLFSFLLAACGSDDQPATDTETAAPAVDEAVADTPAEMPVTEPAEDEAPAESVEESAATEEEIDDEDKPIILAQADVPVAPQDWKFSEGPHYARMVPTQPTVGAPDKIEVAEIFWYGCAGCFAFESFINRWAEQKPANSRFVRIAATWNPLVKMHAQMYYTKEVLGNNGKLADPDQFHQAVFLEIHRRGNRLASVNAIQALFEKHGVSADDFSSTWSSFEVSQKLRLATDLARRYSIQSVPTIVVNGKYRSDASMTEGFPRLLELIDELIVRESVR